MPKYGTVRGLNRYPDGRYFFRAQIHERIFTRSLGRDPRIATRAAIELGQQAEEIRRGLRGWFDVEQQERSETCIGTYVEHLRAQGRSSSHVNEARQVLTAFVREAGLPLLSQLSHRAASAWLDRYAASPPKPTPGRRKPGTKRTGKPRRVTRSARTVNKARGHLRAWSRWLVRSGYLDGDPWVHLAVHAAAPAEVKRRALTPEQLGKLLGVAPLLRRAVYLTAVSTGLRRGELAALRLDDVDLDARHVRIRADPAKNKREQLLFLPPVAVQVLRELLADVPKAVQDARAWSRRGPDRTGFVFPSVPGLRAFYGDLDAAGIPRETPEGRIDFHSLRVTMASLLEASGASLAMAQKLMRHSTPALTANVYTHLQADARRAAVDALPLPAIIDGPPGEGGSP